MYKLNLILILLIVVFVGCSSGGKIDGSSPDAMRASIESLTEGWSEEKKKELSGAIVQLGLPKVASAIGNKRQPPTEAELQEYVMKVIDGRTPEEVIQMAQQQRQSD